jgi:hypothetical protein
MRVYVVAVDEGEAKRLAWSGYVGLHQSPQAAQDEAALWNRTPGMIRRRSVFAVEMEIKVTSAREVQP